MNLDSESFYESGLQKYKASDFSGAVQDYTQAIDLSSKPNGEYYFRRAVANFRLGDHKGAARDLTSAWEIDPKYNQELLWKQF